MDDTGHPRRDQRLLDTIKSRIADLEQLYAEVSGEWTYEDGFYRFYHGSFKVFFLQERTVRIVEALQALAPDCPLNPKFLEVVQRGTSGRFDLSRTNRNWVAETEPILNAFMHARHVLEMAVRYGKLLDSATDLLPTGWGTVLYIYGLR